MATSVRAHRRRSALAILGLVVVTITGGTVSGASGPSSGPVIYDDFEPGTSRGVYLRWCSVELENGWGVSSGRAECLYNHVVGNAHLSFALRPDAGRDGSYGAIVMADTGVDRIMDHYVKVLVVPTANVVRIEPWNRGRTAPFETPIPPEAGFAAGQWNQMEVVLDHGTITVILNGVEVARWDGPSPALRGYVGWVVDSVVFEPSSALARMLIDDFTVVADGYWFPDAPPLLFQISII